MQKRKPDDGPKKILLDYNYGPNERPVIIPPMQIPLPISGAQKSVIIPPSHQTLSQSPIILNDDDGSDSDLDGSDSDLDASKSDDDYTEDRDISPLKLGSMMNGVHVPRTFPEQSDKRITRDMIFDVNKRTLEYFAQSKTQNLRFDVDFPLGLDDSKIYYVVDWRNLSPINDDIFSRNSIKSSFGQGKKIKSRDKHKRPLLYRFMNRDFFMQYNACAGCMHCIKCDEFYHGRKNNCVACGEELAKIKCRTKFWRLTEKDGFGQVFSISQNHCHAPPKGEKNVGKGAKKILRKREDILDLTGRKASQIHVTEDGLKFHIAEEHPAITNPRRNNYLIKSVKNENPVLKLTVSKNIGAIERLYNVHLKEKCDEMSSRLPLTALLFPLYRGFTGSTMPGKTGTFRLISPFQTFTAINSILLGVDLCHGGKASTAFFGGNWKIINYVGLNPWTKTFVPTGTHFVSNETTHSYYISFYNQVTTILDDRRLSFNEYWGPLKGLMCDANLRQIYGIIWALQRFGCPDPLRAFLEKGKICIHRHLKENFRKIAKVVLPEAMVDSAVNEVLKVCHSRDIPTFNRRLRRLVVLSQTHMYGLHGVLSWWFLNPVVRCLCVRAFSFNPHFDVLPDTTNWVETVQAMIQKARDGNKHQVTHARLADHIYRTNERIVIGTHNIIKHGVPARWNHTKRLKQADKQLNLFDFFKTAEIEKKGLYDDLANNKLKKTEYKAPEKKTEIFVDKETWAARNAENEEKFRWLNKIEKTPNAISSSNSPGTNSARSALSSSVPFGPFGDLGKNFDAYEIETPSKESVEKINQYFQDMGMHETDIPHPLTSVVGRKKLSSRMKMAPEAKKEVMKQVVPKTTIVSLDESNIFKKPTVRPEEKKKKNFKEINHEIAQLVRNDQGRTRTGKHVPGMYRAMMGMTHESNISKHSLYVPEKRKRTVTEEEDSLYVPEKRKRTVTEEEDTKNDDDQNPHISVDFQKSVDKALPKKRRKQKLCVSADENEFMLDSENETDSITLVNETDSKTLGEDMQRSLRGTFREDVLEDHNIIHEHFNKVALLNKQKQVPKKLFNTFELQCLSWAWEGEDSQKLLSNTRNTSYVTKGDVRLLGNNDWVNGEVVKNYLRRLQSFANMKAGTNGDRVLMLNPNILEHFMRSAESAYYLQRQNDGRPYNITLTMVKTLIRLFNQVVAIAFGGDMDHLKRISKIFVPIHYTGHWALFEIDLRKTAILYYDSLNYDPVQTEQLLFVRTMLKCLHHYNGSCLQNLLPGDWDNSKFYRVNCPKQNDGRQCGVFCTLFVKFRVLFPDQNIPTGDSQVGRNWMNNIQIIRAIQLIEMITGTIREMIHP